VPQIEARFLLKTTFLLRPPSAEYAHIQIVAKKQMPIISLILILNYTTDFQIWSAIHELNNSLVIATILM